MSSITLLGRPFAAALPAEASGSTFNPLCLEDRKQGLQEEGRRQRIDQYAKKVRRKVRRGVAPPKFSVYREDRGPAARLAAANVGPGWDLRLSPSQVQPTAPQRLLHALSSPTTGSTSAPTFRIAANSWRPHGEPPQDPPSQSFVA